MNHFLLASAMMSGRSSASPIQGLSLHRRLIITHPGEHTSSRENAGPGRASWAGEQCPQGRGKIRVGVSWQEEDNARGEGRESLRAVVLVGTWVPQVPFPAAPPDGGRE